MNKPKKKTRVVVKDQTNFYMLIILGAIALVMSLCSLNLGRKAAELDKENRQLQQQISANSCNCTAYKN